MGNNITCIPRNVRSTSTARVVGPDGKLRRVETPVSAYQLMLETPGFALSRALDFIECKRVIAMRPGEKLLPGEVYVLLPEDRVGSRVDYRQMSVIQAALKKRKCSGCRVTPGKDSRAKEEKAEKETETGVSDRHESVQWRRRSYRWKPFLTTIPESD